MDGNMSTKAETLDFPSINSILQLFDTMQPENLNGQIFTPSLHQENIQLEDVGTQTETDNEIHSLDDSKLGQFIEFGDSNIPLPLVALDAGVVDLGITRAGFALAFKAAIVWQSIDGMHNVIKIGPKVKFIVSENKAQILQFIGKELLDENIFIDKDDNGALKIKAGSHEPDEFKDRIRNYIERVLQLDVIRQLKNGVMLIDGSLTLNTFGTPTVFMEQLAREAKRNNSDIVGVSKKSRITVDGVNINALLDEFQSKPGFLRILSEDIQGDKDIAGSRNLGTLYVSRFAPGSFAFRVDVARRSIIQTDEEVLQALYANTQMTLGYPNILRLAHIHSAFTKAEIVSLQVQSAHDYGVSLRPPEDLSVIFAPFRKGIGG